MAIDLETSKTMLTEWINAEKAILKNQSYKIGDKEFTKVNMTYVRDNVRYWENKVKHLEKNPNGRRGPTIRYGYFGG